MQSDRYKMDYDNKQSDLQDDLHIDIEKWMKEVEKGQQAQKNIFMLMKEVEKGQRAQIKILKYLLKRDKSRGHWVPQSNPSVTFYGGTPEGTPTTGVVDTGLFLNERISPNPGETSSINQNLGVFTTERVTSSRKSASPNRSFTSPMAEKSSANLQKRILSSRQKSNPLEEHVKRDVSPPSFRLEAESRVGEHTNYFSDSPPQDANQMGRLPGVSSSESLFFIDKESSSDSKQPWQKQLEAIEYDPLKSIR